MTVLVLGLGNPILTDDGVGVWVAEAVRRALPPESLVEVSEVSIGGLTLMESMLGYSQVILIDAFLASDEGPGVFHRLTLDDFRSISPSQHIASTHDTSLVTAFDMGRRMGLPLPEEVIIYAIRVENILDFSDKPTPAVAEAIPRVTAAVLQELREIERDAAGRPAMTIGGTARVT